MMVYCIEQERVINASWLLFFLPLSSVFNGYSNADWKRTRVDVMTSLGEVAVLWVDSWYKESLLLPDTAAIALKGPRPRDDCVEWLGCTVLHFSGGIGKFDPEDRLLSCHGLIARRATAMVFPFSIRCLEVWYRTEWTTPAPRNDLITCLSFLWSIVISCECSKGLPGLLFIYHNVQKNNKVRTFWVRS